MHQTALSGQMELARLVDLCAERLGVAVEYDPAVLKGTVTLRLGRWEAGREGVPERGPSGVDSGADGLSDGELWSLMNELLASRGFTTVRQPGARLMSVVRLAEAGGASAIDLTRAARRDAALEPGESVDRGATPPGFASMVLRLKHRAPKDVVEAAGKALSKATGSAAAGAAGTITALGDPTAPDGLVVISDLAARIDQAAAVIELLDVPSSGSVVELVPVRNVTPQAMATLVAQVTAKRELVSGEKVIGEILPGPTGAGGAGADAGNRERGEHARSVGGVLVIAPPERLEYWRTLIQSLDAGEPVVQRVYVPKAFAAGDIASLIEETARTARDEEGRAAGDAADERWRLVIDPLTGSLIITATPTQHAAIERLIAHLESTPPMARRPVRSFVLKNRNVVDVLPIVQELLQQGILGESAAPPAEGGSSASLTPADITAARVPGDARLAGPQSQPPPSQAPTPNTTSGNAAASGATQPSPTSTTPSAAGSNAASTPASSAPSRGAPGASAATSPSARQAGAASKPTTSVLGPALSLSADEATNTLIAMGEPALLEQLAQLIAQLDVRQAQVMLEMLLVSLTDAQTLDLGVELEQLNIGLGGETRARLASLFGIANRTGGVPTIGAIGGQAVVLNPGDFSVVVRALQTINKGRSLSMPSVLVTNNQEATVDSILEQPFATTNTSNSVTSSTSFGGSLPAGTQLSIKPQIAEGDHLTLEYQVSLSSFTGSSSNPNLPPPRQQNQVQSVATIPDGHVVVVGGIDLTTDNQGTSQVPLLGDIPIIGEAFKSRSNNRSKQRFYVFIRANILRSRSFEDLKYISESRMEETGIDDGFPEVEARVIR